MKKTLALIAAAAMLSFVMPAQAAVMLDISGGFNYDGIIGPGEDAYADSQGDDVKVIYGADEQFNLVGAGYGLVAAIDYNGVVALDGIPADGVVTATSGNMYHTASYLGNATYAGNLLEVADPSTLGLMPNTMMVMSPHNKSLWQIASAEAVLPAGQQAQYTSINFLISSATQSHESSQMELYADYTDGSSVLLWAGYEDAPIPANNAGDANWQVAMTFDTIYNASSGADGAVESHRGTWSIYEFSTALALDSAKTLKGVSLIDNDPAKNWFARGAFIMAASATPVPEPASLGLIALGALAVIRRR